MEARLQAQKGRRALHLKRAGYVVFFLVLVILSSLLFAVAFLNISTTQKGYQMHELDVQIQEERKAQESLRLEVARLESPARIEKVAKGNLGMVMPSKSELIRLERSGFARAALLEEGRTRSQY